MDTIHTSVAVVISLIDAVTMEYVVDRKVTIKVRQGNKIIWKDNSHVVILRMQQGNKIDTNIEILIQSSIYVEQKLCVDIKDNHTPVIYNIWLTPTAAYPFTKDMDIYMLENPAATINIARISKNSTMRLIADTDKTNEIKIWGLKGVVEGRKLLIRENDTSEIITLTAKSDNDTYITKELLKNVYHKDMADIYPVTSVNAGEDGRFYMAHKNMSIDEKIEIIS
jgi:hypothetical protein